MKQSIGILVMAAALAAGQAQATSSDGDAVSDPLERVNRVIYQFNDKLDIWVMKPVAQAYNDYMPRPVRTGVSNFFENLSSPMVVVNDVLQGKIQQGVQDTVRFGFNSTLGIAGIIDIATPMNLEAHDEDFGQTLGYWGVGEGWYLVLPLFGPSTIRDTAGLVVDTFVDPVYYLEDDEARLGLLVGRAIDLRAKLLGASKVLEVGALDPYEFTRSAFLQRRTNQIYDGNPPEPEFYQEDF